VRIGAVTLLGLAFVPPTPFAIKDFERRDLATDEPPAESPLECLIAPPEGLQTLGSFQDYLAALPSIQEELAALDARLEDSRSTVAVIHGPPFGTACDLLHGRQHIGSRAVQEWIQRRQPRITLHGHIHESPIVSGAYVDRVGTTWVINPGADPLTPHLVVLDLAEPSRMYHSRFGRFSESLRRPDNP
jgi:uncharacterized protein